MGKVFHLDGDWGQQEAAWALSIGKWQARFLCSRFGFVDAAGRSVEQYTDQHTGPQSVHTLGNGKLSF